MPARTLVAIPGFVPGLQASRMFSKLEAASLERVDVDLVALTLAAARQNDGSALGRLGDALAAALDTLGLDQVDLVAESVSATAALQFAGKYPERVGRLVLAAPVGFPRPMSAACRSEAEFAAVVRGVYLGSPPESRSALAALSRTAHVDDSLADEFRTSGQNADVRLAVQVLTDWIAGGEFDAVSHPAADDALRSIRHPVSLVWGRADAWATLDSAFYLTRRLRNPRLRVFSQCGHLVCLQAGPLLVRHLQTLLGLGDWDAGTAAAHRDQSAPAPG
jgi:pimeloyl-ACP methyl ester carboxylesterase